MRLRAGGGWGAVWRASALSPASAPDHEGQLDLDRYSSENRLQVLNQKEKQKSSTAEPIFFTFNSVAPLTGSGLMKTKTFVHSVVFINL